MPKASAQIEKYFTAITTEFNKAYSAAEAARKKGLDPTDFVEIAPAADVAARVEGLVGPQGVAARIREYIAQGTDRETTVYAIAKEIIEEKFPINAGINQEKREALLEQAVRTGLALFTEGVVSAPIEGVSKVRIRKNADGSECLAVYFAGPIRGAGGTGQAFTLILADYCRRLAGVGEYRATNEEVERYVEESNLYAMRTRAGQYVPKDDELRHIALSCPICIDGEPTEDYEVSVHKNTFGVDTNKVRGGLCLVISEGLCLKAPKIVKITKKAGLNWTWIEKLIKVSKQEKSKIEIKPVTKYIDEIVAGRPIFGYPMRPGAFSLRYGRTRFTGIASKAIHPATMAVLKEFPAIGTQVKTERPGKGCIVTPCETIEGPIVRLKSGEVKKISTAAEATAAIDQIDSILFLGDLLVNYGDFAKANHPLVPSVWCNEWYLLELAAAGVKKSAEEIAKMSWEESLKIAKEKNLPIAPKYTLHWHDLTSAQLKELAEWLAADAKPVFEWFEFSGLKIKTTRCKYLLEALGLPHKVEPGEADKTIIVTKEDALSLIGPLSMLKGKEFSLEKFASCWTAEKEVMQTVNEILGVPIKKRVGVYIGSSMGRPEKAKERKMQPPVHALYPVGFQGGKTRDIVKAVKNLKIKNERVINADIAIRYCPGCRGKTTERLCPTCGKKTERTRQCIKCGRFQENEKCKCDSPTRGHEEQPIDLVNAFEKARKTVEYDPHSIKAVQGLISADKVPEPMEKGILRAKHDVFVFRDGTCRFDATEVPITHFVPREIDVGLARLRELGYEKDIEGKPLENEDQVVELRAQDLIINEHNADYFLRVAAFVDDLMVYYYQLPPYYNSKTKEDLVGQLVIAIAPHISAGIIGRIIGFTKVRGILMHPYLHCATRRNTDGDEDCLILLMDALVNFSKKYLPATRGGKMDAPLVLTSILDPSEVDDEVHAMDVCSAYPLEFYQAAERFASPGEVKLDTVATRLGKESQYEGMGYTHAAALEGPTETRYVQFKNMKQKVSEELDLMMQIRAVDAAGAAERIILSHFFPDLYGNLHSFSKQSFRCIDCEAKYRRVPLRGKCSKCGGKIILTISKGGIEKYLKLSQEMADKYNLPLYLKQRLMLLEKEIASIFEDDKSKQFSLADYL